MAGLSELAGVFPEGSQASSLGRLVLGGCDTIDLAARFGTPLYVFDETTLHHRCTEFLGEFSRLYPAVSVAYASKAFINKALAVVIKEEGLSLDVVSGGEMAIARAVGFPPEKVYFHGNNKSREELDMALEWGVGRVVADNFHELSLLEAAAGEKGKTAKILLRLSPGVDAHAHAHTTTGILDSKFGFPIATGQAEEAIRVALSSPHLRLVGLHCHLGSPVLELGAYSKAIEVMIGFAAEMKARHGFELLEFSPGGGFPVQYLRNEAQPSVSQYAGVIVAALKEQCRRHGMPAPKLTVEPGRAIVGRAGVALYRVGASKSIPGIRRYVSVDGGMADNIRPAIYGSRYEAVVANKLGATEAEKVTIAGRFCESGDILVRDIALPVVEAGDIIAIPASGAYCLAMASNYNASLKPAIVMVKDGTARLVRKRETYEDLMKNDVV
ncbi:MAG: diaminopimelate decarboxylase [Dehalococcoidia bacterium]|nr:diaminopimelate decarboxylase [Dehalococcoidia bacterium]